MTEHSLQVARTARYYQLGKLTPTTRQVWVVLHGYGQLAAYFLRHFAHLTVLDPDLVVLAPEGLSRFYLSGNGGRVGASWMTREDRLSEITDQADYLQQLVAPVLAAAPGARLTVLGFSQGAATASRWLLKAGFRPARLILWAGAFPEDIDPELAGRLMRDLNLVLVAGKQDEYVSAEQVQAQLASLRELGAAPELVEFGGGHTLDAAVLRELLLRNDL